MNEMNKTELKARLWELIQMSNKIQVEYNKIFEELVKLEKTEKTEKTEKGV